MTNQIVRTLDALEDRTDGYLTLLECEHAVGRSLAHEIEQAIVLVDYRTDADGEPVTLARLNRRHPAVRAVTSW